MNHAQEIVVRPSRYPTEEQIGRFTQVLPLERMHAGLEDGQIVGGAGAFPFDHTGRWWGRLS